MDSGQKDLRQQEHLDSCPPSISPSSSRPLLPPEATVGALILDTNGRLFLFQSHKWRDAWAIPGGHIEPGESAIAAVHREVFEETGLQITDVQFLCYQECLYDPAFWKDRHFIFLDFVCRAVSYDVTLNDEAEAWAWFTPEQLKDPNFDIKIEPFTRKVLDAYFQSLSPTL